MTQGTDGETVQSISTLSHKPPRRQSWDESVQYARRGMEKVGIRSNKEAWPDMKWFQAARELDYHRLDY